VKLWLRALGIGAISLSAALLFAWLSAIVVLHESPSSVRTIEGSILLSGGLAFGIGTLVIVFGMPFLPRLSLKVGFGYLVGSVAGILTVLYTPLLMFKTSADLRLLAVLLVCFLLISLGLAAIVSTSVTPHLQSLREAAQRIALGDFHTRVDVASGDELSDLADAFNRMSRELGNSFAQMRTQEQLRGDLVAAISHDLGTPLTSMRVMIEAIRDGVVQDADTITQYHDHIHKEITYLDHLIDDLFELSRLESTAPGLDIVLVDVQGLVLETVERLRSLAEQRDVLLEVSLSTTLSEVDADPIQIQRVITNLIQNGIQHTPASGTVRVGGHATAHELLIDVANDGEAIQPESLQHVFERFYRDTTSRSRQRNGAGLGLAIAKAIVEAHKGRIWVENVTEGGTRFAFTLPLVQPRGVEESLTLDT